MTSRTSSRSMNQKRSLTAVALWTLATTAAGFTSSTSIHRPLHLEARPFAVASPLHMENTSAAPETAPRLTREEEIELLRQAAEGRRLAQLEQEMAIGGKLPLLSVRAKAAGYGNEFDAYEDAKLDAHKARNELVTRNMGLVYYCVNNVLKKKRSLNSLSMEDLVQEGAIGLARAVDKYNPTIGGKFSTYAVYWIRAAVLRCVAERDDIMRVPSHVTQAVHEINKAAKRLGMDLDNTPLSTSSQAWKEAKDAKRLAEEAGLSDRNFVEAMKVRNRRYSGGYVAFESWMQKGQNLASDVPLADALSMELDTASMEREELRKMLSKFVRPKEMEALSWRYGLVSEEPEESTPRQRANRYLAEAEDQMFNGALGRSEENDLPAKGRFGEAMSFSEVGKKMKVSAEYGRRLCHAGIAKLKKAAEDGRLEPILLF